MASSDERVEATRTPTPGPLIVHGPVKPKTWTSYIWDSFDKSPQEQKFLRKLDSTLLVAASLGVLVKFIDQSAVSNAFVSGMKEDLGMYGNQLNYANAFFAAGYVVGQIPSNLLLTRSWIKPHYYVPVIEVLWTIATFASSQVSTVNHLYAVRFFLGLFEAGHFPAVMYIAASWYTPEELAKRSTLIQISVGVGPMFSGFLQAGVYTHLNGVSGRPGWKWLFLIDGCISLPIALLAFLFLPDTPVNQTKNWLFTEADIALGRARKPLESFKAPEKLSLAHFKRVIGTWQLYWFAALFVLQGLASQPSASMAFWLKSYNTIKPGSYTVAQINTYPTPIYAVNTIYALVAAWSSDTWLKQRRWPPVALALIIAAANSAALGALPVYLENRSIRWGLYYMTNIGLGCFGVIWTWQASCTEGDPVKRAVVGANMNGLSSLIGAWYPILAFPTQDQPNVKVGNYITTGLSLLGLAVIPVIIYYETRDKRRGAIPEDAASLALGNSEEDEKEKSI